MNFQNPFKNELFEKKIKLLTQKIELYLNDMDYNLEEITIKELIQWNDSPNGNKRLIYTHEKCPIEIKHIIQDFINKEFEKKE